MCKDKRNGEGDGDGVHAGVETRSSYDDDERVLVRWLVESYVR